MSVKNRTFSSWNRDHHKTFAAAIAAELEKKADIDSPNFTGIPTAPTAEQGTKNNQVATTEFVADAVGDASDMQDAVSKSGDTMSGELIIDIPPNDIRPQGTLFPVQMQGRYNSKSSNLYNWQFAIATISDLFYICCNKRQLVGVSPGLGLFPAGNLSLGYKTYQWAITYTHKISNGDADILVPSKSGTLALVSDIEDILRKYNLIPAEETTTEEQN